MSRKTVQWLVRIILPILVLVAVPSARAQLPQIYPTNFELLCPPGFNPANTPDAVSFNPTTNFWRAYICVDPFGNLTLNQNTTIIQPPPGPGTGSTGVGGCSAALVLPGMFCGGPVPQPNGGNPTFEVAYGNNSGTNPASPISVTGFPLTAANTLGLDIVSLANGAVPNAPDGTWTTLDSTANFTIYRKQFTSTNSLTITNTFTSTANSFWTGYLAFLGGTFSSSPHNATSGTVTCSTGSDQCAQVTINSVAANNALLMVGFTPSNSVNAMNSTTVVDSVGDVWQKIGFTNITGTTSNFSTAVWLDQSATAGTHVVTLDSHQNSAIIGGCCKMYEIAGTAPYFTGAAGPSAFRYLTQMDLINAGIVTSVASFKLTTLSSNVTITNAATNAVAVTITAPQAGCPCRAFIAYSGWANFAGVTNEPDFDFWVTDGTTKQIPFTSGQSNASTGATTSVSASGYTNTLYANGQTVTFTLQGIVSSANAGTQTFVYQAAQPTGASGANSFLQVIIVPNSN